MFKRQKAIDPNQQIPQPLYDSLRQNTPRRGRWILEVLLAAVIVAGLGLGIVLVYNHHAGKSKAPTRSQSTNVQQSPQNNKTPKTGTPAKTSVSNSSNSGTVTQPNGN